MASVSLRQVQASGPGRNVSASTPSPDRAEPVPTSDHIEPVSSPLASYGQHPEADPSHPRYEPPHLRHRPGDTWIVDHDRPHDPEDPGVFGSPGWRPDNRTGRHRRGELPDPLPPGRTPGHASDRFPDQSTERATRRAHGENPEKPPRFSRMREAAFDRFMSGSSELAAAHLEPVPPAVRERLAWLLRWVLWAIALGLAAAPAPLRSLAAPAPLRSEAAPVPPEAPLRDHAGAAAPIPGQRTGRPRTGSPAGPRPGPHSSARPGALAGGPPATMARALAGAARYRRERTTESKAPRPAAISGLGARLGAIPGLGAGLGAHPAVNLGARPATCWAVAP